MTERNAPIYLDHNATTPTDPRVVEAMLPYFTGAFGNPSSVEHLHGHEAQTDVAEARTKVARALGARDNEIIFTGSCTEANNIAILGAARAQPEKRHVITTAVEHPAVFEPMRHLARDGYELTIAPVDELGRVDPEYIAANLRDDTLLVSVMGANNEVGTRQPIREIGSECERRGALFHADLAQIMAHGSFDVVANNVHLASVSGHKAYGPKGIGALYARSRGPRARLAPISYGGGQERGLRSGTLNVPMIVGLAEALTISGRDGVREGDRLTAMCRDFALRMQTGVDGTQVNGDPDNRVPGNCSLSITGIEPLALMRRLRHVASFSASSACATDKVETSHVLLAMFGDTPRARHAFRVSPGRFTTKDELSMFADAMIEAVNDLRKLAA